MPAAVENHLMTEHWEEMMLVGHAVYRSDQQLCLQDSCQCFALTMTPVYFLDEI
jgi:hypothetical protein